MFIVYDRNRIEEREDLWLIFRDIFLSINELWGLVGDFNDVLFLDDRMNRKFIFEVEIKGFKNRMEDLDFFDMKFIGNYYIWLNGNVKSMIDRVMCN